MARCKSEYQNWDRTGQNGKIVRCTREAGHPVIEETIPAPEGYRTVTTQELKFEYTLLHEGHQWLRRGHAVQWPDRAARKP